MISRFHLHFSLIIVKTHCENLVLVCYRIIDTQVARQGRQYHRNPPYKKRIKLVKKKPPATHHNPTQPTHTTLNPTQAHATTPRPTQPKPEEGKFQLEKAV